MTTKTTAKVTKAKIMRRYERLGVEAARSHKAPLADMLARYRKLGEEAYRAHVLKNI